MEFGDWDGLWIHAGLATMQPGEKAYGAVENAAIAVKDGRIAWLGGMDELPAPSGELAEEVHDVGGRWITPGLIDCHTHVVFGGNRAAEFEMRLEGATYEQISRAGGGIRSTVTATRSASEFELVASALPRVDRHGDDALRRRQTLAIRVLGLAAPPNHHVAAGGVGEWLELDRPAPDPHQRPRDQDATPCRVFPGGTPALPRKRDIASRFRAVAKPSHCAAH